MIDYSGQYLGRYYLTERLGEGGMAVVYKAFDTRLERDVAIKIIRSGAFPTDEIAELLKRFEREAKSLAKLSHPNIVKVYDYGEHDGSPYIVMEYLPGGTLKKLLGKPVPWQEAVHLILPVARGISYAHQRGILHRDIKPANILITESGEPMLSDFGIAKLFEGEQATTLTGSGMAIGTPEYMAPEQWTGTTSPQSDLYSLGIVLYELVTGRKPFLADTPAAILIKQATESLPSPRKFVMDVPESLEKILYKVLAREPENRYTDVRTFVRALEGLQQELPIVSHPNDTTVEEKISITALEPDPARSLPVPDKENGGAPLSEVELETNLAEEKLSHLGHREKNARRMKNPRMGIVAFIAVAVVSVVLILNTSLIRPWLSPTPTPTSLLSSTAQPVVPSRTVESIQSEKTPSIFVIVATETRAQTAISEPQIEPLPTEITDVIGVEMVLVPGGDFIMGSISGELDEKPVRTVYLNSFYIDKYEVTNKLYSLCVDDGVCDLPRGLQSITRDNYYGNVSYSDYPVMRVDWYMANTYCEWRDARLPTESEWEKSARGTDGRMYPWGDGINCSKANYGGCVGDTTRVGSYQSGISPYGAYDMAGNVWEWVFDLYNVYPGNDQYSPSSFFAEARIFRGGSLKDNALSLRTSNRNWYDPTVIWDSIIGFRCARDATP